jgi:SAM-dependent methyltransferase
MEQNNTATSFSEKWHKNESLALKQTLNPNSDIFKWITTRNGFADGDALRVYLSTKRRVLDGGCGNGRVTILLREYSDVNQTQVVGIDLTAADVAEKNLAQYKNVTFFQKNLLDNLTDIGTFDFIYCQEVLHHTGDAQKGFNNLVEILDKNGEIAIYVYKKKAPIREFVDDYIRNRIVNLSYEDAMAHCRQLTSLGKQLSEMDLKVQIPQIDILEISAGEYDLQRFIYHFFAKFFWNPEFSFEDNAVINYDWYHPQDCTRHTITEVKSWFDEAGLEIVQECEDFYGITMRGKKNI